DVSRALHIACDTWTGHSVSMLLRARGRSVTSTTIGRLHRTRAAAGLAFLSIFEFRSRLLQRMIEVLFSEAVRRMVGAFEKRARDLYASDARRPRSARALRLNCWPLAQKCKMSHGDQQPRHTRNRKGPKKRRLHRRTGRSRHALSRRLRISIYPIWRPRR